MLCYAFVLQGFLERMFPGTRGTGTSRLWIGMGGPLAGNSLEFVGSNPVLQMCLMETFVVSSVFGTAVAVGCSQQSVKQNGNGWQC